MGVSEHPSCVLRGKNTPLSMLTGGILDAQKGQ